MTRTQKRVQRKQQEKCAKIIAAFMVKYHAKVEAVKVEAANRINTDEVKGDFLKNLLSNANVMYLSVWRGVVLHIRETYPMAAINPNYFSSYIIWE